MAGREATKLRATSNCRSCGAPIRWGQTEAGQRMPLDCEPQTDGNVIVLRMMSGTPIIRVFNWKGDVPNGEPFRYRSHFASCPDASAWRRR